MNIQEAEASIEQLTGTVNDTKAQLQTVSSQLDKIQTEVQALIDAAGTIENLPESFTSKLAALQTAIDESKAESGTVAAKAQTVDDQNPDAPV